MRPARRWAAPSSRRPGGRRPGELLSAGTFLSGALGVAVLLAACGSDPVEPEPQVIEETEFAPSLGVDLAAMTKAASGLYYQDIEVGEGPTPQAGDSVTVRYAGYLSDGTGFDDGDLDYVLGQLSLIDGWVEAVAGMQEGGVRKVLIPPALGYGSTGSPPDIPGGAILVFDMELLRVVQGPF